METQLDLLVAWGFHKVMSLMVSLYANDLVRAYKDEKWGVTLSTHQGIKKEV
jgi:hypothetical protein